MMRDLAILVKYRLRMWGNIRKRRGRKGMPLIFFFLIFGGIAAAVGYPMYVSTSGIFRQLVQVQIGSMTFADVLLEVGMLGILSFILITDTPAVILNVFMSEDVGFLLTLPLSQTSIFYSKVLDTMVQGGFPALFMIPMLAAYVNAYAMPWYQIVMVFVMYALYFLISVSISSLLALVLSKFTSKSGVKRFSFFTMLISIIAIVLLSNTMSSPNMSGGNVQAALSAYAGRINAFFLPSTWMVSASKGNIEGILAMVFVALGLGGISYWIASNSILKGFSNIVSVSSGKKAPKGYRMRGSFMALVSKDFKLMRREPSILFLLIYPAVFPAIFMFSSGNSGEKPLVASIVSVLIASMYVIYAMGGLVSIDVRVRELVRSFPIADKTPLWSKAVVVITAFGVIMLASFVVFSIFTGDFMTFFINLLLALPVFVMMAFFGAYAVTIWPNEAGGARRPFSQLGNIIGMLVGFGGAATSIAEGLYIHGGGQLFGFSYLISALLFLVLPIVAQIVLIFIIRKLVNSLNWSDPFRSKAY